MPLCLSASCGGARGGPSELGGEPAALRALARAGPAEDEDDPRPRRRGRPGRRLRRVGRGEDAVRRMRVACGEGAALRFRWEVRWTRGGISGWCSGGGEEGCGGCASEAGAEVGGHWAAAPQTEHGIRKVQGMLPTSCWILAVGKEAPYALGREGPVVAKDSGANHQIHAER